VRVDGEVAVDSPNATAQPAALVAPAGQGGDAGACEVETGDGPSGFIMTYDPKTVVTEVIATGGTISVSNGAGEVSLTPGWSTLVVGNGAPEQPTELSSQQYAAAQRRFDLIGKGRAESQTVDSNLIAGHEVPVPERAPEALPPRVSASDQPWEDLQEPVPQPITELLDAGLGIDF
jgi:hypothetical protein